MKFLYLIIFINFFLINTQTSELKKNNSFKLGLENIPVNLINKLKKTKKKIGLITNQTGIDQKKIRNIDLLLSQGLNITAIYVPEHGITGKVKAEKKITDSIDFKTKIPIISLYEGNSNFKKFNDENLKNIDLFIFDIQDSGMRHYTYISILYKMMEVASKYNKKFIVLDRPNPLGIPMEGPLVDPEYISFISIATIPLRHALTIGELAKVFNENNFQKKTKLLIIPMKNYQRTRGLNGILPIFLSPAITDIEACLNYSFLGILGEINPINVGVGTNYSFKCITLPSTIKLSLTKWNLLKVILFNQGINSTYFKFKKKGINYAGLKIKIKNINKFSSFNTLIKILKFFKENGIKLNYSKSFNKVMGINYFSDLLETDNKKNLKSINNDLKSFLNKIKNNLIYYPLPNPSIGPYGTHSG